MNKYHRPQGILSRTQMLLLIIYIIATDIVGCIHPFNWSGYGDPDYCFSLVDFRFIEIRCIVSDLNRIFEKH
jgi:hypothetical protein